MIYYKDFDFSCIDTTRIELKQGKRKISYLNIDFAVDIETSSFYHNDEKCAYPYLMSVNICGNIVYCRYMSELFEIFQKIKQYFGLTFRKRIIMFVHNLAYEFQFFRDICRFSEVFARSTLKPMKCFDYNSCIEFRCSYTVSGLKLIDLAKNLKTANISKLSGDEYDYNKIRHSKTPLTDYELKYSEHDVLILHYWILEEIQRNKNDITQIPLTQTGYIRRDCREYIFNNVDVKNYRKMIIKCTPDKDLFILLHNAFGGGDTHANFLHNKLLKKLVDSLDFASSYPAVMVKCKFPRKFIKVDENTLDMEYYRNFINKKACVMCIGFDHIEAKRNHHILSFSKCKSIEKYVLDNGRVVSGDKVMTYMTDIDFKDFENFYNYKGVKIYSFYYSDYQYLPTPFVKYILQLFEYKTTLKGLEDEHNKAMYLQSKQFINGLYGMAVTNIVNDDIEFVEGKNDKIKFKCGWAKNVVDIETALKKYKYNNNSFLLYQWGVWVTSYARHFLRDTIAKIEDNSKNVDDFIYCDTDSIKLTNYKRHKKIFDEYNKQNEKDMKTAMEYHGFPIDNYKAKTKKGNIKTLGAWEFDGHYEAFKTLGAKRYMYYSRKYPLVVSVQPQHRRKLKRAKFGKWYDGGYNLVVSGVNKKPAMPYILDNGGFSFFKRGMTIPKEHTGKATHTYISRHYKFDVIDYLGNVDTCEQTNYIHLEQQEYTMKTKYNLADILQVMNEFLDGESDIGTPYYNSHEELNIRQVVV